MGKSGAQMLTKTPYRTIVYCSSDIGTTTHVQNSLSSLSQRSPQSKDSRTHGCISNLAQCSQRELYLAKKIANLQVM